MTTAISDSLVLNHIRPGIDIGTDRNDILHLSANGTPKVLTLQEGPLMEWRSTWQGKESEHAALVAYRWAMTRATMFYIFYPVVRSTWAAVDLPCYPRVAHTSPTITGITRGADTTVTWGAGLHGLLTCGTHTYVYITGIVDNNGGGSHTLQNALNGKLHLVKTWTDTHTIVLETDTSAGTAEWASGGTAAQATFMIRGKSVTAASTIVKEAGGAAKTYDTHYDIEAGGGTNGEDLIQCEEAWIPADAAAITCAFTGRRRYYVWWADTAVVDKVEDTWVDGEYWMTCPFNVNEAPEDD